jgi:hypothetical protein
MEVRSGSIWGRTEWTPDGRRLVVNRSYSYLGVAIEADASGSVRRMLQAALVNALDLVRHVSINNNGSVDTMSAQGQNLDFLRLAPTKEEIEIGRRMNVPPETLAEKRKQREENQSLIDYDAKKRDDLLRGITDSNDKLLSGHAAMTRTAQGKPSDLITPEDRVVCKQMNIDPRALATHRLATRAGMPSKVASVYLSLNSAQNFPNLTEAELRACREAGIDADAYTASIKARALQAGDQYSLTDAQRLVCQQMGIDADDYLAWVKRTNNRLYEYSA